MICAMETDLQKNHKLTKAVADVCLKNGYYPYETEAQREDSKCIFCGQFAIAIYYFDEGCVAKSNKVQALCFQHENKAQPVNNMKLLWRRNNGK